MSSRLAYGLMGGVMAAASYGIAMRNHIQVGAPGDGTVLRLVAIGGIHAKISLSVGRDGPPDCTEMAVGDPWNFIGSILAGMVVYTALHWNPEVNYASVDSTAHAKLAGTSSDGRAPFSP